MMKQWPERAHEWIALNLVPGLGNIALKALVEKFGNPKDILEADIADLMGVEGLRAEIARKIVNHEYISDPSKVISRLEKYGVGILTYLDPVYPPALKQIHDPPMLLYYKGNALSPKSILVAMVGSRNSTHYGLKAAEKIAQGLARRGIGVISGMARGIDAAAHWGCLEGKGFTAAVLGTGIDVIYPASNKKLFDQICENGIVLTEFPLGTPPEPKNFPIRNRIISGLSRGVVVVEANRKSGSLITASLALEQGREVFAIPGSIDSFKSTGCHYLIKQGAKLIENADDILDELGLNYNYAPKTDTFRDLPSEALGAIEKLFLEIIGDYPMHIDQIAGEAKLESGEVAGILTRMELKGIIRQLPGKLFVR